MQKKLQQAELIIDVQNSLDPAGVRSADSGSGIGERVTAATQLARLGLFLPGASAPAGTRDPHAAA